jgi:hypothetical protein
MIHSGYCAPVGFIARTMLQANESVNQALFAKSNVTRLWTLDARTGRDFALYLLG